MNYSLFNRTIFLWVAALAVSSLIVNPRAALFQRLNTMNEDAIDCLRDPNCNDTKAIAEAREHYRILAELYPDYGRGFEMEGACYLLLRQDNLAIKKFQEAIRHNPDLFWVSFELGKVFYNKGEYAQALKYFQTITTQDNNTLLKKATLSNLRQFPDQTKKGLMLELVEFVNEIKLRSNQITIGCLLHQGDLTQAKNIINSSLNNPPLGQNDFFMMADKSLEDDDSRKKMLLWIDSLADDKPVFHPWSYVIQPVKEILYR